MDQIIGLFWFPLINSTCIIASSMQNTINAIDPVDFSNASCWGLMMMCHKQPEVEAPGSVCAAKARPGAPTLTAETR